MAEDTPLNFGMEDPSPLPPRGMHPQTAPNAPLLKDRAAAGQQSLEEVESLVCQRLEKKLLSVRSAFRGLDVRGRGSVSVLEFKRVLRTQLALSTSELNTLLDKVARNSVTVDYMQFLTKYSHTPAVHRTSSSSSNIRHGPDTSMPLSDIQKHLQDKIGGNMRSMIHLFRLFDYGHEGRIQRHEFRRILDNYCLPLTDKEFHRAWNHYSPDNHTSMSYKQFLDKLGLGNSDNLTFGPVSAKIEVSGRGISPPVTTKQNRQRPASQGSTAAACSIRGLTHNQLHNLFHREMCRNWTPMWHTLQAVDAARCGLVKREVLRAVLSSFLFPVDPHTFYKLTSRYGVRATGQVKWRHFLGHFMSTGQQEGEISPYNDRAFEQAHPKERQSDLREMYSHLKEIFHLLDKKGAGWLPRAELNHALAAPRVHLTHPKDPGCTTTQPPWLRLPEEQVRELLNLLDPEHVGVVHLASLEGLNPSVASTPVGRIAPPPSPAVTTAKPPVLTDETTQVDNSLLERLREQISSVLEALKSSDPKQTGYVLQDDLRKILLGYDIHITQTHFQKLCESSSRPCIRTGWVYYSDFLRNLGVPVQDKSNRSTTWLTISHKVSPAQSPTRSHNEQLQPPGLVEGPVEHSALDAVVNVLRERLAQRKDTLNGHMLTSTHSQDGLSEMDLRKMLVESQITLEEKVFHKLTALLGFQDGHLNISAFQAKCDGERHRGELSATEREKDLDSNQGKTETRNKTHLLSAEECLALMQAQIKTIHGDNLTAFRLMDRNRDGMVYASDFRQLYNSLRLVTVEKEYQRLLHLIGLHPGANLNYKQFVRVVQNGGRQQQETPTMLDRLHEHLAYKARHSWPALSKALCQREESGQHVIFKNSLKKLFFIYNLPMSPREFEQLWSRYDPAGQGCVTDTVFLDRLGVPHDGESELAPTTDHQENEDPSDAASLEQLDQVLQKHYKQVSEALNGLDRNSDGTVSVEDLLSVLQTHIPSLQQNQLVRHLHRLKLSIDKKHRKLGYLDFLSAFSHKEDKESIPKTPCAVHQVESLSGLGPGHALATIQQLVRASAPELHKAFSAFDPYGTGMVKALEFRRLLESFCARLSDNQYRYLLNKLKLNSEHLTINWKDFLNKFKSIALNDIKWTNQARSPTEPMNCSIIAVLGCIQEVVSAHMYDITKAMEDFDQTHNDTISKEDFRQLCEQHFMKLSNYQFERLWSHMPVNALGRLWYKEFLQRFSNEGQMAHSEPGRPTTTPSSALPCSPGPREAGSALGPRSESASWCVSKATGLRGSSAGGRSSNLEQRLRLEVQRCGKKILGRCTDQDPHGQGQISTISFLDILSSLNISVMREELEHLLQGYDTPVTANGQVSYHDFLRHFLLNFKAPQATRVFKRRKLPMPTSTACKGIPSRSCVVAMLRMYEVVRLSWRPIRRYFLTFDRSRTGTISTQEFRKVLQHFNVSLSEEEFFHVSSYLDASAVGNICYDDFLRVFLH